MVGSSFVLNSRGVLKRAQFLIIAMVAALVVATALAACPEYGKMRNGWATVGGFTRAAANCALPELSESVAPSSTSAAEDQSDNTTTTVTSGGAVKASFTVVPQPASNQEESMAAEDRAMPNNQARTTTQTRPESGRLTPIWGLLAAAFSMGIAAIAFIASRRGHTRKQALLSGEPSDQP
jgi:hypothetical protein